MSVCVGHDMMRMLRTCGSLDVEKSTPLTLHIVYIIYLYYICSYDSYTWKVSNVYYCFEVPRGRRTGAGMYGDLLH